MDHEDFISRLEHQEFTKRIDAENKRQNNRIDILEQSISQITDLTISVKELASNISTMCTEQERQRKCLEEIDKRDGEKWRNIVTHIITSSISIIVGYLFFKIGINV